MSNVLAFSVGMEQPELRFLEFNKQMVQPEFNFFVMPEVKNDPNRKLMIAYKYDKITDAQLEQLHSQLSLLIYDIIKKYDFYNQSDEIYQEVWIKIAKCRGTWNEWYGTQVSTWIGQLTRSVIFTFRKKDVKYNQSTFATSEVYDGSNDYAVKVGEGELSVDPSVVKTNVNFCEKKLKIEKFVDNLTGVHRQIVELVLEPKQIDLSRFVTGSNQKHKMSRTLLCKIFNVTMSELCGYLNEIKSDFMRCCGEEEIIARNMLRVL